jgi:glycosyltransferase involved in cell wall biosynthesis
MLYGEEVEVIVIDDGSKEDLDAVKLRKLQLNLKVYKILDKNGYNPCVPYNVGVRQKRFKLKVCFTSTHS